MALVSLAIFCMLFIAALTHDVDPTSCAAIAKCAVKKLDIEPWPAVPGENATATAYLTCKTDVKNGTLAQWQNTVTGYGMTVKYKGAICDAITNCPDHSGDECDCPPGDYTASITLNVVGYALSGKYAGRFTAFNWNGDELVCVTYTLEIHR